MRTRVITAVAATALALSFAGAAAPAAAVNLSPSFTRGPHQALREDAGPQTLPAWATEITAGAGEEGTQTLFFTATSDNEGLFAAAPAVAPDGTLTFTPAPDASGSAIVTLTLRDDGGTEGGGVDTSAPRYFSITVLPVNDVPSFAKGADLAAAAGAGPQAVPGWATAIARGPADEASQSLAFTLTTDAPALFSALPALSPEGTLTFTPAPGAGGVATVTATLADDGGTANGGTDESAAQGSTITVGDDRPYAVAAAAPAEVHCPTEVTFDGTASFRGGGGIAIVSHEWDLHHEGSFAVESAGTVATATYGELGVFTAALRVTDAADPAQSDVATAAVTVANRAPAAAAGGPYTVAIGQPLALHAAGSADPDAGCGDRIASYAWDLDGDGDHDDAAGIAPVLGWEQVKALLCGGACAAGEVRPIDLLVTDANGLAATAAAAATIAPAAAKLTLTWPNGGELLGTGVPQTIRWVAGPEVGKVSIAISADGKKWRTVVSGVKAAPGAATWTPAPAEFKTTSRSWRFRAQGFRSGRKVAGDSADAPVGIGPLDVTAAERGVEVPGGDAFDVAWTTHRTAAKVAFTRFRSSCDGGATWSTVRLDGNPGHYLWPVPQVPGRDENCRVRVDLFSASGARIGRDDGEGTFTILGGVDLTAPEAGDSVYGGTIRTVRWTTFTGLPVARTRLDLSRDGGASWEVLATADGNPGRWRWEVPEAPDAVSGCRIRVALLDAADLPIASDDGEGDFTILLKGERAAEPPASIAVPAGSGAPGYAVGWGASATPGATYELEEATDEGFTAGLRAVYAGGLLSAAIDGRENGTTYYYHVRAVRPGMNPSPWIAGANGCAVSWVDPPLGPVTGFTASLAGSNASLSWVNPGSPAFAGVRVLRRGDRSPQGPDDGLLVFDGPEQAFTDPMLDPGAYFYAAFARDGSGEFAPPARAAAHLGLPTRCEECHAGGPTHPQAPNVINGPLPGTPGYLYNWSGTNGFRQDGGHGDPQGRGLPGATPVCEDCHDLAEPPPGNLHLNGVLESVFDDVERSANTAHLKGEFFTRFPALAPGGWSAQVAVDNYCAYACHIAVGTRVSSRVPDMRHEVDSNGIDFTPDPVSVPGGVYTWINDPDHHWSVGMGEHLTAANGDALPNGKNYPMDQDLTTAASGPKYFAPCVACHDPHGTTVATPVGKDRNFMVRDDWIQIGAPLCLGCHQ